VEVPLLNDTDNPETTLPATQAQYSIITRKNGIRAGKLYAYTQNESMYHCPADQNINNAEPYAIFRSYSIAGLMNGEDFVSRVGDMYTPINRYRTAVVSPTGTTKTLIVAIKASDITTPSSKYVFVEESVSENFQPLNYGGFVLLLGSYYNWWDWPAYYHNDSSTFGFADGHAERHRWQDSDTIALMRDGRPDPRPMENEDLHWMVGGYLPVTP
jgi:prepilin-type processing-associated H-X9-DG protein